MNFMIELLGAADANISGSWALELIGKIFAGLALLVTAAWAGYKKAQTSPERITTIKSPVPEVTVRPALEWASRIELAALKSDVDELRTDVDAKLDKILEGQERERGVAREALGKVHARADKTSEALAEVKGELKQISTQMERLLDLATKRSNAR